MHDSPSLVAVASYICASLGGIAAATTDRNSNSIGRSAFFFISGVIFFVFSFTQLMWLAINQATVGGYFWILFISSLVLVAVTGYLNIKVALGRSRDICGRGWLAFLALAPVLNISLLVVRPMRFEGNRRSRLPGVPTGIWGIALGLLLAVGGSGILAWVQSEVARSEDQARSDPDMLRRLTESSIASRGLESTLQRMAANAPVPLVLNDYITLTSMKADGKTLSSTYQITVPQEGFTDFRGGSIKSICSMSLLSPLLSAGASIQQIYIDTFGITVGDTTVNAEDCKVPTERS